MKVQGKHDKIRDRRGKYRLDKKKGREKKRAGVFPEDIPSQSSIAKTRVAIRDLPRTGY